MAMVDDRSRFFDLLNDVDGGLQKRCAPSSTTHLPTSSIGIRKALATPSLTTLASSKTRRVHFDTTRSKQSSPRSRQSSTSSVSATSLAGSAHSPIPQAPSGMERQRPKILGIHHLKFAVSNLDVSIAWYERVLGGRRVAGLDHHNQDGVRFAAILEMVDWGGIYLELRQTPQRASKDRGWDPVTLTVRGKEDLEGWIEWLERWGTVHSPLLAGKRGWILVFEDPDGRRFRMYTREDHGGKTEPSCDVYWLAESP